MSKDWTTGGFDDMDDETLRRFYDNARSVAERTGSKLAERAIALLPLIEEELKRRNANRPVPKVAGRRAPRSENGRVERQYADAIAELVRTLASRYDMSAETALRLSRGFPSFKPRQALGRDGDALVGGAKMAGRVAIDRYTAYRVKDQTISLSVILEKGEPIDKLKYIVQASPSTLLKNPEPLTKIRSTANDETSLTNGEHGELFQTFSAAAECYESLISQLAPAR